MTVSASIPWRRWGVAGADARAYLHSQATQDLTGSLAGAGRWTGFLAPTGELQAVALVAERGDELELLVPEELAGALRARLERFVLRSRVRFEDRGPAPGPYPDTAELVAARWPGPHELARQLTPHAFGRAFVEATVSFTKGCYPGQELVARLESRGSLPPWRLVWGRARDAERLDAFVRSAGPAGPQGLTTVVAGPDGEIRALGIAHRTLPAAPPGLEVDVVA